MGTVGLHDLVGSVASSIVEAQGLVELHYLKLLSGYFDETGRPVSLDILLPSAAAGGGPPRHVGLPLLSLVETSPLAITEMQIELEVELGDLSDAPIGADSAGASGGLAGLRLSPDLVGHLGAPVDVIAPTSPPPLPPPAAGGSPPGPAPASDPAVPPPTAAGPPARSLNVGLGARIDASGPVAKLSIKVVARPPSEGLLRLVTQLNQTV
ncbi:MAG: DUF2589 domain-containing protein [Janthinobacterium lividum]